VNYFVSNLSRKMRKQIRSIPEQVMEILTNCPWKGNVRELANLIERAVILSHAKNCKCRWLNSWSHALPVNLL